MTFTTEAERVRAREAAVHAFVEYGRSYHEDSFPVTFDRLYPPVVKPAAPEYSPPPIDEVEEDMAFRDAAPSPAFAAAVEAMIVRLCAKSYDGYEEKLADVRKVVEEFFAARAARVRCWLWSYSNGKPFHMAFSDPTGRIVVESDEVLTPGWFVPDEGAE